MLQQSVIHIVNGDSAGGTIRQALGLNPPSDLLISHDLYSCGPLLAIGSPQEWHKTRLSWWLTLYAEQGEKVSSEDLCRPAELIEHAEAIRSCEVIMLWIGTGLADQLLLAFVVQLLRILDVATSRLQVIQYDCLEGYGPRLGLVIGTGELNGDQFRSHPAPRSIEDRDIDVINAAWTALIAPEPEALLSFCSSDGGPLPFLTRAVRSLLLRYPDYRSGLSIWDHTSLQYTLENGPKASQIVGHTMAHDWSQPDWPGDIYLYSRLQRLGAPCLTTPLVSFNAPNRPMRETTVTITDAGRAVLNGEANAVALNGIDDWVAGVHLDSKAGRVWFRRDGELVPAV